MLRLCGQIHSLGISSGDLRSTLSDSHVPADHCDDSHCTVKQLPQSSSCTSHHKKDSRRWSEISTTRQREQLFRAYQHGKTCGDIISQLFSSFTDRQTINTNKEFIFEDMSNCNVPHGVNPEIRLFYFQQTTMSCLLQ